MDSSNEWCSGGEGTEKLWGCTDFNGHEADADMEDYGVNGLETSLLRQHGHAAAL